MIKRSAAFQGLCNAFLGKMPGCPARRIRSLRRLGVMMLDCFRHALRPGHAKSHGLVKAGMEVYENLPETLRQGLIARLATYPVIILFSPNPGGILPDSISTPRGMSFNVLGVEGEMLLRHHTRCRRCTASKNCPHRRHKMALGKFASEFGKGLLAGLIGTVAITVSQTIEAKIRDRAPSSAPADAAGKVLGVQPTGDEEKTRFSNIVHFGYGTFWGGVRGLLGAFGLPRAAAIPVHMALVQGSAMIMLPGLKVAPPVSEWGAGEIGIEALHHLVYSVATDAAYVQLSKDQ